MGKLRISYIIGTYPSFSTTFIDREIRMMRRWGLEVHLLAIRSPVLHSALSQEQQLYHQEVIYLIPVKWLSFLGGHLCFLLTRPGTYLGTLLYLLTRPHSSSKDRLMTLLHFAEGVYAAHLLKKQSVNHLHAHFVDRAAIVALVSSRLLNVPYSLTAHANDIYVKPVLLRTKISGAKFITTCTAYNEAYLLQTMGEDLDGKLHLAYHGLDLTHYQPSSSRPQRDCPLVLSVGRLTEKKGFPHLIAACRRLKDRGYDFTCDIVGEGPQRQELETLIAQLGLEDTVILCGAIPHEAVIEKYKNSALFVLPCVLSKDGDRDGIPNVLLEAMAMQIPVVSTRHSGIPELVQDRVNGLLVSPGDEEALTNALAELLDNPDLRGKLGRRGRQKVVKDFDVEHNARRLFDLFVA
jgi:glycosyltransferase involved in cell wall biosynthesis